ncbi:MAG: DUF4382 domain-containing protein [Balneolaceae bacterium]|nr:DUF4382 domain-containing protein [Balneolaceae bacterium]
MKPTNLLSKISTASVVLAMVLFAGCTTDSNSGTGTFEVRLHDAPASFDEVNVFVESVEVNRVGDADGWVTISEPQRSYDLLTLRNGAYEVLGEAQLEPGTYPQIRLTLSQDGHSVVVDGEPHDMFVPSGAQTGIKLEVNAEISEGIEYILLLDFDASRSVVSAAGQENPQLEYLLQPVISATNQAITGNIEGNADPATVEPVVYAISGEDTLTSTYANASDGYFQLTGLEEGSYTVSVKPTASGYETTNISDVQVTVGETNGLGTVTLDESQ